jgi:CheY-like chemotaxis protein
MRKKFKILHLEDVATDAELAARELRQNNLDFEHLIIDTEQEYLHALVNFKPDIILCDHSLPSFNSREALNIKRTQKLHIPFILVTATMTDEVALGLIKDGADDYVLKDRLIRLPNAVKNALDKYGLERERQLLVDNVKEKEAESQEILKTINNKIVLATKAAGLGVWDYFVEEDRIECDALLLSLCGLKPNEFDSVFHSWINIVHPSDRTKVKKDIENAWKSENYLDTTYRIIHRDGSTVFLRSTSIIEFDNQRKPYRMIGTCQNITASLLAEKAIQSSEAFTQGILNSLSSHIAVVNGDGIIIKVNQSWRAFADNNNALKIFNIMKVQIISKHVKTAMTQRYCYYLKK